MEKVKKLGDKSFGSGKLNRVQLLLLLRKQLSKEEVPRNRVDLDRDILKFVNGLADNTNQFQSLHPVYQLSSLFENKEIQLQKLIRSEENTDLKEF